MQVRKEKEAELFANDQYWANRLKNQEAEFLKNSKIMEQEFNDTVSCTRNWLPLRNLIRNSFLGERCQETICATNSGQPAATLSRSQE